MIRILLIALLALPVAAQQYPTAFAYEGVLNDGGSPATGTYDFVFRLWDASTDGTLITAVGINSVAVTDGAFSVEIDYGTSDVWVGGARWLETRVRPTGGSTFTTLAPRTPVMAVPMAHALPGLRTRSDAPDQAPTIIGGWQNNSVGVDVVGGTIGGGGGTTGLGIPQPNVISDGFYGVIGGGADNEVSNDAAVIGGGSDNVASGQWSTIGGGDDNEASGSYSSVPGGSFNVASGRNSLAAGLRAKALHDGAFVWSDRTAGDFTSTGEGQFLVRASGGVGIGETNPDAQVHVSLDSGLSNPHLLLEETLGTDFARFRLKNSSSTFYWDIAGGATSNGTLNFYNSAVGDVMSLRASGSPLVMQNGAYLSTGGTWTNASSVHLKTDFREVDGEAVLAALADLPIQVWRYRSEAGVRHIGPTAQDFAAAFGLGDSEEAIATVDADGVALAAIQALLARVEAQEAEIARLRALVEPSVDQEQP